MYMYIYIYVYIYLYIYIYVYIYIYITQIYMSGMCRSALHSIQHALTLVYTSFPKQNKNNIYCMYIYIYT